jgi:hypothetical protein
MKRLTIIAGLIAVAAVWPAVSPAATFNGIVVGHQRGALLVASSAGAVRSLPGSAALGARVAFSGGHAVVLGRARTAHIRGTVVRRVGTTVFLSSNTHLVAVHLGRKLASVTDSTPAPPATPPTTPSAPTILQPGDVVSSQVTIQNGELDEDSSENLGQTSASAIQVQALVSAVGPGTVTLTVGTQTLTVPMPGGLTLPASLVGQTVTLSLSLGNALGTGQNGDDQGDDDSGGGGGATGATGATGPIGGTIGGNTWGGGGSAGHGNGGGDG